jgi:hypothetical protein
VVEVQEAKQTILRLYAGFGVRVLVPPAPGLLSHLHGTASVNLSRISSSCPFVRLATSLTAQLLNFHHSIAGLEQRLVECGMVCLPEQEHTDGIIIPLGGGESVSVRRAKKKLRIHP